MLRDLDTLVLAGTGAALRAIRITASGISTTSLVFRRAGTTCMEIGDLDECPEDITEASTFSRGCGRMLHSQGCSATPQIKATPMGALIWGFDCTQANIRTIHLQHVSNE